MAGTEPHQGFDAHFLADGVRLRSRGVTPAWEWEAVLVGYGRSGNVRPVAPAELRVDGNRVEYRRGTLVEWYVNDTRGLEQGFTLSEPPAGRGEIVLELELAGTLRPELAQDGRSLVLRDGARTLQYAGPVAFDATGRHLEARLALASSRLTLRVDDRGAVYPVTIDPLFSQVKKLTADDAATGDFFGLSVAISGATALVGAINDDDAGHNSGSAYVFETVLVPPIIAIPTLDGIGLLALILALAAASLIVLRR